MNDWTDETQAREQILAYPPMTLLRIGWEIEPGRVQGSIFYRLGDGLGPTSRDQNSYDVLRRAVQEMTHMPNDHQRGGIEVLARPVGLSASEWSVIASSARAAAGGEPENPTLPRREQKETVRAEWMGNSHRPPSSGELMPGGDA